jgi:hypothetical protein
MKRPFDRVEGPVRSVPVDLAADHGRTAGLCLQQQGRRCRRNRFTHEA